MKESIGQAFILNLILFFFVILVLLLFGSINYSKAFKAKNRIITIIEKYGEFNDGAKEEIANNMVEAGYSTIVVVNGQDDKCNEYANGGVVVFPNPDGSDLVGQRRYDYCVIRHSNSDDADMQRAYYQVVAFMKFEIPILGGILEFPVRGETRILYDNIYEVPYDVQSNNAEEVEE